MTRPWWLCGAHEVLIFALCMLAAWALLSWATAPNAVLAERTEKETALHQVAALETRVARYPTFTPVPCRNSYGYGC